MGSSKGVKLSRQRTTMHKTHVTLAKNRALNIKTGPAWGPIKQLIVDRQISRQKVAHGVSSPMSLAVVEQTIQ
jgi:hypothetical protein